jgi:hypothetical protein
MLAVEELRLMTNGPGPPRRGFSGNGDNRSSMLKCQMSSVTGARKFVAIKLLGGSIRAR